MYPFNFIYLKFQPKEIKRQDVLRWIMGFNLAVCCRQTPVPAGAAGPQPGPQPAQFPQAAQYGYQAGAFYGGAPGAPQPAAQPAAAPQYQYPGYAAYASQPDN